MAVQLKEGNMDRFNTQEEIEFEPEAEARGYWARVIGKEFDKNPYNHNRQPWLFWSWAAGWVDADMSKTVTEGWDIPREG